MVIVIGAARFLVFCKDLLMTIGFHVSVLRGFVLGQIDEESHCRIRSHQGRQSSNKQTPRHQYRNGCVAGRHRKLKGFLHLESDGCYLPHN